MFKKLKEYFPSKVSLYGFLLNGITGLIIVLFSLGIYYILNFNFIIDFYFKNEVSVVLILVLDVIFLVPKVEQLGQKIKAMFLSEYLVEDGSTSKRYAYKRFNLESLIRAVFPDMVKMSESKSGRMAILSEEGFFNIYNYTRGRQRRINIREEYYRDSNLIQFIKSKSYGISITEVYDNPSIQADMDALNCNFIIPFLFRDKIFGFVAFTSIPNKIYINDLVFLANQAGMVIHNHLLASNSYDNSKYMKEYEVANRIQSLLQTGNPPPLDNHIFKINKILYSNILFLEFYKSKEGENIFVLLSTGKESKASGIVLSYILGTLYSRESSNELNSFWEIKDLIKETCDYIKWSEKIEIILGVFSKSKEIQFYQSGHSFRVIYSNEPQTTPISIGWKNTLILNDKTLEIYYKNQNVVSITEKSV
jgi:hypothetical protein